MILERRITLWKLKKNILNSDLSHGMSLECSNLFSRSQGWFLKEKGIGSSKLTSASEFGVTGRLSFDGCSIGRLLSDRDGNSKPVHVILQSVPKLISYFQLKNCPPFPNLMILVSP